MAHPLVVHCKRSRYNVYIGRPSKWGNPFVIGRHGTREQVIERYKQWVLTQPQLLATIGELAGKTLGCWCAPRACHGEVLVQLAAHAERLLPTRDRDWVIWRDKDGRCRGGRVERVRPLEVYIPDDSGLEGTLFSVDPAEVLMVLPRNNEPVEVPW